MACVGTEVELTATGGSDYLWSTGERTATITVTPMSTSSYICLISNAGGCDTTITHTIQVMSAPSVSVVGNRAICEGESLTLRAIGADFYRWSGDVESEGDSLTVAPMVTTTYQLTAIGANGCETTRAITVVVNDFADAYVDGILNICPGASTTLTVQGNGTIT